jgi:uncharacterized membrane protein
MTTNYRWTHATATAIACGAIAYQTAVIWESMTGVPIVHKLGIPLATISAALLPVLAEAAWRSGERAKGILLVAPVIALLAFVLPAGVSRLGEAQQARVNTATTSAAEQARIRADLARADKLVAQAQEWVASECRSGAGTKCKGVTYTLNQRQAYQRELSGKVETFTPVTTPWLPSWHPALLPIGLELAIVTALFFGLGPLTRVQATAPAEAPAPKVVAITERDFRVEPITEEEIDEIKRVLGMEGLMNRELARRLGVSEGQCSKIVTAAVEAGKLSKQTDPANKRAVIIKAA